MEGREEREVRGEREGWRGREEEIERARGREGWREGRERDRGREREGGEYKMERGIYN